MNEQVDIQPVALQCLDIWGGNLRTNQAVSASGIEVWVSSSPHGEGDEGGDIHYISSCDEGILTRISLADVSGHGEIASHMARHLHTLMRENINALDHTDFARRLNDGFKDIADGSHYATALVSGYHAPSHELVICNAGHPRPLKYCGDTEEWAFLDDNVDVGDIEIKNVPFGVVEGTDYTQFATCLGRKDVIVFYSDSFIEVKKDSGELIGEEGLLNVVKTIPVDSRSSFNARVVAGINEIRVGSPLDDETIISIWRV